MELLETSKQKITANGAPVPSKEEGKQILQQFALDTFGMADDQDRAGNATRDTARTFYASGIFMDALKQFGELEPDVEEKAKYAKYKAQDIAKALKEGRKPSPGAPGEEVALPAAPDNGMPAAGGMPAPPDAIPGMPAVPGPEIPAAPMNPPQQPPQQLPQQPPQQPMPTVPMQMPMPPAMPQQPAAMPAPAYQGMQMPAPPAAAPAYNQPPQAHSVPNYAPTGGTVSKERMEDCAELARFAVAAVEAKDVELARNRLQQALQALS